MITACGSKAGAAHRRPTGIDFDLVESIWPSIANIDQFSLLSALVKLLVHIFMSFEGSGAKGKTVSPHSLEFSYKYQDLSGQLRKVGSALSYIVLGIAKVPMVITRPITPKRTARPIMPDTVRDLEVAIILSVRTLQGNEGQKQLMKLPRECPRNWIHFVLWIDVYML